MDKWKNDRVQEALDALKGKKPDIETAIERLEYCQKIADESRERGIDISDIFDKLAKGEEIEIAPQYMKFVEAWRKWVEQMRYTFVATEIHLISPKYMMHGSPDVVGYPEDGIREMCDYKCKARKSDYKTRMNEELYCEFYEDMTGVRLPRIRIVTFHPESARVTQEVFGRDPNVLRDALLCKDMIFVNERAQDWFMSKCRWKLKP